MTGIELIAAERQRQIEEERRSLGRDAEVYTDGEFVDAAMCYASQDSEQHWSWPWSDEWWNPSDDPVRNLVKAGALIAAEIDRLQREVGP